MAHDLLTILENAQSNKFPFQPHGGPSKDISHDAGTEEALNKERDIYVLTSLESRLKENSKWLAVLFVVLIGLVIFLSVLLWRKQDNLRFLFAILSGQGLSILFCVNRLSYLYTQKRNSEIFLYLYQTASPGEERKELLKEIIDYLKQSNTRKNNRRM